MIGEVMSIGHPRLKVGAIDATNFDSPNSVMERISEVWQDPQPIKVTLHYLKTATTTLLAKVGITDTFKITLPNAANWTFAGFISDFGGADITPKGLVEQDLEITLTGKPGYSET